MFIIHFAGIVKGSISDMVALQSLFRWKKINKALTDAVEIEDEASILLDHDYDGIKELDNNLPPWWKYGFYVTIVWAVVYIGYYHVFRVGNLQQAEYEAAMEAGEREIAEYKAAHPELINADNVELLTDNSALVKGKGIYDKNCASCHMEGGAGGVGPNLTDNYWIYGNDIKGVFITISEGAQNGMKAWKNDLPPDKIQAVASYILSLEYIAPENGGKEPQGEEK
jgi:cytochrome c oxidase cbb3-type subunit 3